MPTFKRKFCSHDFGLRLRPKVRDGFLNHAFRSHLNDLADLATEIYFCHKKTGHANAPIDLLPVKTLFTTTLEHGRCNHMAHQLNQKYEDPVVVKKLYPGRRSQ